MSRGKRPAGVTCGGDDEAGRRFQGGLAQMGVDEALRQAGVRVGDNVRIGEFELEWEE